MKLITFTYQHEINEAVRDKIVALLNRDTKENNIAISGGTTPLPIFKYLGEKPISSEVRNKLSLYWVDERYVPVSDSRNNYSVVNRTWLKSENKISKNPIITENTELEKSAKDYLDKITPIKLDLVILGMGEDGHIASIFPNQKQVDKVFWCKHPTDGTYRISMNYQVLIEANEVILLIKGIKKKKVLLETKGLPVHHLMKNTKLEVYYIE